MKATSPSPSLSQILESEKQIGDAGEEIDVVQNKNKRTQKQICLEELQSCFLTTVGWRTEGKSRREELTDSQMTMPGRIPLLLPNPHKQHSSVNMTLNTWEEGSSPDKAHETPVQNEAMVVTETQNKALNIWQEFKIPPPHPHCSLLIPK